MVWTNFRKLRVYQEAMNIGEEVWRLTRSWDRPIRMTLGCQFTDAADSIAANIAEGAGRGSPAQNRYHLGVARGSLYETQCWLDKATRRELVDFQATGSLDSSLDRLARRLNAYINSLKTN